MAREFLTDVDLKSRLLLGGSAGSAGQPVISQGPGQPAVWGAIAASAISDFNDATRAQTEAALVAGSNVTLTPSGSGASRQITLAANVATDLSYDAATREVRSSTGVDALLPLVSTSSAGLAPATSFAALTYGATTALDFSAIDGQARTITLAGNLELTTSNLAAGRTVVLRLLPGASQRTLTFPVDWVFIGSKPANIAASKTAVLSLTAFGTTNADVVAAYAVQS